MPQLRNPMLRRTKASRDLRTKYLSSRPFPSPHRRRGSSQRSDDVTASVPATIAVVITEQLEQPIIDGCPDYLRSIANIDISTDTAGSNSVVRGGPSSFASRVRDFLHRSNPIPAITIDPPTPPPNEGDCDPATQNRDLLALANHRPQSTYTLPTPPILEGKEPPSSSSTSLVSGSSAFDPPSPDGHVPSNDLAIRFPAGRPSESHNVPRMPSDDADKPQFARAIVDWDDLRPTSLGLRDGNIIQILGTYEDRWADGMRKGGRGWFPEWAVEGISIPLQLQGEHLDWDEEAGETSELGTSSRSLRPHGMGWDDDETSSSCFSATSSALDNCSGSSILWDSVAAAASYRSSGSSGSVTSASVSSSSILFGHATVIAKSDTSSTSNSSTPSTDSLRPRRGSSEPSLEESLLVQVDPVSETTVPELPDQYDVPRKRCPRHQIPFCIRCSNYASDDNPWICSGASERLQPDVSPELHTPSIVSPKSVLVPSPQAPPIIATESDPPRQDSPRKSWVEPLSVGSREIRQIRVKRHSWVGRLLVPRFVRRFIILCRGRLALQEMHRRHKSEISLSKDSSPLLHLENLTLRAKHGEEERALHRAICEALWDRS